MTGAKYNVLVYILRTPAPCASTTEEAWGLRVRATHLYDTSGKRQSAQVLLGVLAPPTHSGSSYPAAVMPSKERRDALIAAADASAGVRAAAEKLQVLIAFVWVGPATPRQRSGLTVGLRALTPFRMGGRVTW